MLKNILAAIGAITLVKLGYEHYEKHDEIKKRNKVYEDLLKKHKPKDQEEE